GDGIPDRNVTGVQTCALPIWLLDQETGELGMLAVDDKYQGTGIGRELIRFAEERGKKENLRKMLLELLVPIEGSHPTKVILENRSEERRVGKERRSKLTWRH